MAFDYNYSGDDGMRTNDAFGPATMPFVKKAKEEKEAKAIDTMASDLTEQKTPCDHKRMANICLDCGQITEQK